MDDTAKVEELLSVCRGKASILILPHNNPDPDSLASSGALQYLLEQKAGISSTIAYGGILGREENRTFKKLMQIKAVRLRSTHFKRFSSLALIDCQPGSGNVTLPPTEKPLIVIDHHSRKKSTRGDFIDIQPDCGATATILVEYLQTAEIGVPPLLATALYYALISETQHLGREVTDREIRASTFLFPLVRHRLISRIEHPVHSREFFQQLYSSLGRTFTYKSFVGARLGTIYYPSFVAQLADLLVSLKRCTWCFVTGRYRKTLHLSLRTTHTRARAGKLLQKVIGGRGSAGGHDMIAGGQIKLAGLSAEDKNKLEETLFKRLFKELGLPEDLKPNPLVIENETQGKIGPPGFPGNQAESSSIQGI
ncbi:MAG: DHH family phosphoesterase [Candidatus Euphemobacter frigidus]|nr:DHH family phosphoesterase [Candidatus Euphemobacter frigidus]MDP8276412.1 DHH family phosphoesterase [Candidatus Euphemobacter frigidus]